MPTSSSSAGARLGRAAARLVAPHPGAKAGGRRAQPAAVAVPRALGEASKRLLGRWGHTLRRLAHQLTAIVFLLFALSFGAAGFQGWYQFHHQPGLAHHAGAGLLDAPAEAQGEGLLALLFAYFGLTSFARAHHSP